MIQTEAIAMIQCPEIETSGAKNWLDLGSGNGTFTRALASLLPSGSGIHAMDQNQSALNSIPDTLGTVAIIKHYGNFLFDPWPNKLDGLLMANALHFVKNKDSFLLRAFAALPPKGTFLLVEYDLTRVNQWVPYPLNFKTATKLFHDAGFSSIRKLNERPSVFNSAMMYSVIIGK